jgi:hypothetical protein
MARRAFRERVQHDLWLKKHESLERVREAVDKSNGTHFEAVREAVRTGKAVGKLERLGFGSAAILLRYSQTLNAYGNYVGRQREIELIFDDAKSQGMVLSAAQEEKLREIHRDLAVKHIALHSAITEEQAVIPPGPHVGGHAYSVNLNDFERGNER